MAPEFLFLEDAEAQMNFAPLSQAILLYNVLYQGPSIELDESHTANYSCTTGTTVLGLCPIMPDFQTTTFYHIY